MKVVTVLTSFPTRVPKLCTSNLANSVPVKMPEQNNPLILN